MVGLSLLLGFWRLDLNRTGNLFYAAAARSMNASLHNFLYASYDPGGWVTVDKPPLALWVEAASVHLFGMSSWALLGPSVVATGLATWLLVRVVQRSWGRLAGLVAGLAWATTPVVVALSRSNNPDAILALCLVAAAACTLRAIEHDRIGWLLAASALVGAGFLTKLLAALLVVPALWTAYLVCADSPWRRRVGHLVLAAVAIVVVSGAWVVAVDHAPLGQRPWVGGSGDGRAVDLVFGYNGLGRITGSKATPQQQASLAARQRSTVTVRDATTGEVRTITRIDRYGGPPGPFRLFDLALGDQVMWLAPIAAAGAVAGIAAIVRRRCSPAQAGAVVLFTVWTATTYAVFASASGTFHNYYVSLMAPGLAGLAGIGAALARRAGRVGSAATAAVVGATGAFHLALMARIPAITWLRPVVAGAFAVSAGGLVVAACRAPRRPVAPGALASVALVAVLAPLAWSIGGVTHRASPSVPGARPASVLDGGLPSSASAVRNPAPPGISLGDPLVRWLRSQRRTERWIVAVPSSGQADQAIIAGDPVMAMNGYSGTDPILTPTRLAGLLRAGDLRFVLTGSSSTATKRISVVIRRACAVVAPERWGATTRRANVAAGIGIYDCRGAASAITRSSATTS